MIRIPILFARYYDWIVKKGKLDSWLLFLTKVIFERLFPDGIEK
jgi:hypothetical protein